MARFRIGDTVDFTADDTGGQFTGRITDVDFGRMDHRPEYEIRVDAGTGGLGYLKATADKMRHTDRNGGAR